MSLFVITSQIFPLLMSSNFNILIWPQPTITSFIILLVLIYLNKMGLPNEDMDTLSINLTLFAHFHLPFKYRDSPFETIVTLINRLPTRLVHFISPYQIICGTLQDIKLAYIFGHLYHIDLFPYTSHQLKFRTCHYIL